MRCHKIGFTLAEVLITLGIIGVVAAMTMPSLIANYQKKQVVTQLKKSYSEMSQAVKMAEIEHGDCGGWNYNIDAKTFYDTYIKQQLNKTQELTYNEYKQINKYTNMNGTNCSESWCADDNSYYILLSNGSIVGFLRYLGGNYKAFTVDINGFKKPNKTGKDYFIFSIQEIGVVPYGVGNSSTGSDSFNDNYDRNIIKSGAGRGCSRTGTGVWCSALILTDGWEIKDDYPW